MNWFLVRRGRVVSPFWSVASYWQNPRRRALFSSDRSLSNHSVGEGGSHEENLHNGRKPIPESEMSPEARKEWHSAIAAAED